MSTCQSSFVGGKRDLSEQGRARIRELWGPRPLAFLFQALSAWGVIVAAIGVAVYVDRGWATLIAMMIVATRLNVLGLLVHEQAHVLGLKGRYGDLIVNVIAGYPIGISVENYANIHLAHHKFFFTDDDPDFLRKRGDNWTFPMRFLRVAWLLFQDVSGITVVKLLREKNANEKVHFKRTHPTPKWARAVFYGGLAAVLTWFSAWPIFLIYWVVPLVTMLPLIVRLGAVTEHVYGSRGAGVLETTPLILLRWWEKLLLPNLNFTMHAYHHFYPGISFCNLPKVHAIFRNEGLVDETQAFFGYWAYLRWLMKREDRNTFNATNGASRPRRGSRAADSALRDC